MTVAILALIAMPVFSSCASAKRLYKWKEKVAPMITLNSAESTVKDEVDEVQVGKQRKKTKRARSEMDKLLRKQYKKDKQMRQHKNFYG